MSEIFARVLFCETIQMRSSVKIKPSRKGQIILSFTDVGKSCHSRKIFKWQICLLTLFAEKNSRKNFMIYSNIFVTLINEQKLV